MKRVSIGLGALALAVAVPLLGGTPVLAQLQQAGESIVETLFQPKMQLHLSAEKQVIEVDEDGQETPAWQALEGDKAVVHPGDVLRYSLTSENAGDKPAASLVVTQPVPAQTVYILESARDNGATVTFSIDGGQTFVAEPVVEVTLPDGTVELQPAPAEAYTHIRWDYSTSLAPMAAVKAVYEVSVK